MLGKKLFLNDQTITVIEEIGDHIPGGFFIYKAEGMKSFSMRIMLFTRSSDVMTMKILKSLQEIPSRVWYIPKITVESLNP